MKKIILLTYLQMIGLSCFSQILNDSLIGFDQKHEIDHIKSHNIEGSQIDFYLNLAKKRYINKKYSLGFYTMLLEIDFGIKSGAEYYYPGYVVPNYFKFDYKLLSTT